MLKPMEDIPYKFISCPYKFMPCLYQTEFLAVYGSIETCFFYEQCKHVLAMKLSEAMDCHGKKQISDKDLADLLCEAIDVSV